MHGHECDVYENISLLTGEQEVVEEDMVTMTTVTIENDATMMTTMRGDAHIDPHRPHTGPLPRTDLHHQTILTSLSTHTASHHLHTLTPLHRPHTLMCTCLPHITRRGTTMLTRSQYHPHLLQVINISSATRSTMYSGTHSTIVVGCNIQSIVAQTLHYRITHFRFTQQFNAGHSHTFKFYILFRNCMNIHTLMWP